MRRLLESLLFEHFLRGYVNLDLLCNFCDETVKWSVRTTFHKLVEPDIIHGPSSWE